MLAATRRRAAGNKKAASGTDAAFSSVLARPEGFEPPTAWFVARYSIQLSYGRVGGRIMSTGPGGVKLAEREGFEPSMGFNPHTPLAGERLQPLGHLSDSSHLRSTPSRRPRRIPATFRRVKPVKRWNHQAVCGSTDRHHVTAAYAWDLRAQSHPECPRMAFGQAKIVSRWCSPMRPRHHHPAHA